MHDNMNHKQQRDIVFEKAIIIFLFKSEYKYNFKRSV